MEIEKIQGLKDEFVSSLSILTRLCHDANYMNTVHDAYLNLKKVKAAIRIQLLKENDLEDDDLRDLVENLANLLEEYKTIADESD